MAGGGAESSSVDGSAGDTKRVAPRRVAGVRQREADPNHRAGSHARLRQECGRGNRGSESVPPNTKRMDHSHDGGFRRHRRASIPDRKADQGAPPRQDDGFTPPGSAGFAVPVAAGAAQSRPKPIFTKACVRFKGDSIFCIDMVSDSRKVSSWWEQSSFGRGSEGLRATANANRVFQRRVPPAL